MKNCDLVRSSFSANGKYQSVIELPFAELVLRTHWLPFGLPENSYSLFFRCLYPHLAMENTEVEYVGNTIILRFFTIHRWFNIYCTTWDSKGLDRSYLEGNYNQLTR
jgi:hypothetical protein